MKMKRRRLLQSLAAAPAAGTAALAMAAAAQTTTNAEANPRLATASLEALGVAAASYFSKDQLAALTKLGDTIAPASGERPSASQAGVPEFLDFLVSQSPADIQSLYRDGLDRLVREGVRGEALRPLTMAWTYAGPADRFAQFLQRAKADILQATMNSREWAEGLGRGRRGSSPTGYYWRSIE